MDKAEWKSAEQRVGSMDSAGRCVYYTLILNKARPSLNPSQPLSSPTLALPLLRKKSITLRAAPDVPA